MYSIAKFRRVSLQLIALICTTVVLSGCLPGGFGGPSSGQSIDPNAPVPVALLIPKGASGEGERAIARDLEAAARLAAADLNGARIDLRVYDTAGQPGQSAAMAKRAVADGAKIILGPLFAEGANAAAVAVAANNVNVMSFSNNPSIAGGNLFVLGQTFNNTADRLMGYAVGNGRSRIVTAYSDNVAGTIGRDAIQQAAARNGGTVVASVGYPFSESGVASAVPRIKRAIDETGANALFLTANSAGALPVLSQMLPEAGVNSSVTQFIGLARWDKPSQSLGLPGIQGGWFAMPDPARVAQFNQRFTAANGRSPHALSSLAYDGISAIGALVQKGKRDALQTSGLTQRAGFQGASGAFRFLPDGTTERALAVAQVQGGQAVIVSPAPTSFGGFGF